MIINDKEQCPCCSNELFEVCCKPILTGRVMIEHPVQLIRARFVAHIVHDIDFIIKTMKGKALKLFDREATEQEWFKLCHWTKLELLKTHDIKDKDSEAKVEFKAHYIQNNESKELHEKAYFSKISGHWYYVSGRIQGSHVKVEARVGRNDPCACNSGKKYKRCCARNT